MVYQGDQGDENDDDERDEKIEDDDDAKTVLEVSRDHLRWLRRYAARHSY